MYRSFWFQINKVAFDIDGFVFGVRDGVEFVGDGREDGGFSGGASARDGRVGEGLPAAALVEALWSVEDGGVPSARVDGDGGRPPWGPLCIFIFVQGCL